jgi:hypothetical protein
MSEQPTCPAALNIAGEHFPYDWQTDEDGKHPGWAHANRKAEAIWADDPRQIHKAWASAEEAGR